MTHRDRYLETLLFGTPDRVPFEPGAPRESTLKAWHAQGLERQHLEVIHEAVERERGARGLAPVACLPREPMTDYGVSFQMLPKFEEKVLEHRDGHYVVQDWMGAITEIADTYDYTYIRSPRDFVTRKWHRFPVQTRADWEERIKWRFDPKDAGRFPADFAERCARLRERDFPLVLHFNGPFWQLREFCGLEGLCRLLLEQPDFVREMASFWADFVSETMQPILAAAAPDMLHFSEDMCFKAHPMLSPDMTMDLCGPGYRQWIGQARAAGVRLFGLDSDGDIGLLLPVWIACGINCVDPLEVAAGNDIRAYRAAFGRRVSFLGGIDKRAIAAGGAVLREELARVQPVVDEGGYIPSCDHGVPPDISWRNFQDYALQLAQMTGWLA